MKMSPFAYRACGPRWKVWRPWYATQPTAYAPKFVKGDDGMITCTIDITPGTWVRGMTRKGALRKVAG